MKPIQFEVILGWSKTEAEAALRWSEISAKTSEHKTTQKERESFAEGIRQGFLRAVAVLKMHGLHVTY